MRILIVGAGIAGPTLAYWLRHDGHQVTLVESAPQLRKGGYVVDFWGAGFDVAEHMGIIPRLMREGYVIKELREVSAGGWTLARVDPAKMIADCARDPARHARQHRRVVSNFRCGCRGIFWSAHERGRIRHPHGGRWDLGADYCSCGRISAENPRRCGY